MTPDEILSRATNAKRLIEDKLVIEALSLMEKEVIEAFAECPVRDLEGMRLLQMELRRVRKFRSILQGIMESGALARHELREQSLPMRALNAIRR